MPNVRRGLPLHPLLFASYAVLFLYASNLTEADLGQVLPVLLVVVGITTVLLVVGAIVLRDAARAAILLSAFVVIFFGYRHVAIIAADSPIAGRPLQALCLLLGAGALVIAWRGGQALRVATQALNALGAGLIIVALVTIVPHELEEFSTPAIGPPVAAVTPAPAAEPLRDIWFLVFDRYGSGESLKLNYGIDERFTPWLAARGFHVTPDAHANYSRTRLSMASILNLDYLDALPPGQSVANALKDHALGRYLTGLGYRYVHIGSRYEPTRTAVLLTAFAVHQETLRPRRARQGASSRRRPLRSPEA